MNVQPQSWPWPTAPSSRPRDIDPIVLQIVEGTLNSIEAEIEYAIERTARSPMIREAHDYRVGLFDRYCRKLTGRSYSAMPNAVVRDFPPETMRPGDVFLMNDTYLTEGSIGHLPDLCSTVPVFHDGEVVAYIQAFGHHDDIGGAVRVVYVSPLKALAVDIHQNLERPLAEIAEVARELVASGARCLITGDMGIGNTTPSAALIAFFTGRPVTNFETASTSDSAVFARFHRAMLDAGVWLPPSQYEAAFVSTAHGPEEIDLLLGAARQALATVTA